METEPSDTSERLREALEQQRATSEILAAISRAPFELDNTLRTILEQGIALCRADTGRVWQVEGSLLRERVKPLGWDQWVERQWQPQTLKIDRTGLVGRAVLDARTQHVPDMRLDPGLRQHDPPLTRLAVPIIAAGTVVGVLNVHRLEVAPFSPSEIALIETFADQAAIAIENVRLVNETKDALDRQTASGTVLRAIADTREDLNPVLQTIVDESRRLCAADSVFFYRLDGAVFILDAIAGLAEASAAGMPATTLTVGSGIRYETAGLLRLALDERRTFHVPDMASDETRVLVHSPRSTEDWATYYGSSQRSRLAVPVLYEGAAIGIIRVHRTEPGGFNREQIGLVESFAAQAAIAIRNVRLFIETKEALERQTATSEVLEAISTSTSDVQPVFDALVERAARLCDADMSTVNLRVDADQYSLAAAWNLPHEGFSLPHQLTPIDRGTASGRVYLEGRTMHWDDFLKDPELSEGARSRSVRQGVRSLLCVPINKDGKTIGTILLRRSTVRPFAPRQIELVETFAGQAAIAIENVRLFNETIDALERQTAIGEILEAMSGSAGDLDRVFKAIVESAVRICDATNGGLVRIQGDTFRLAASAGTFLQEPLPGEGTVRDPLARAGRDSLTGRVLLERRTQRIDDIRTDIEYRVPPSKNARAIRSMVGVPIIRGDEIVGVIVARRVEPRPFSPREVEILETFARQAAIAIENVRLFNETREKSAQLEVANQELAVASKNKSEFLANMSHELRTPLNAVIGFSDVLEQRMFGELSERQSEYVRDIATSGRQLLELVNEILDLSKVEAGRMELEPSEFAVSQTIRGALTFVRERASGHGIVLNDDSPSDAGTIVADERKIRQVLLNLLSNAVKFTPDGGRVTVCAVRRDTEMQVSVTDTGIGIAPEDQPRVFEEFRQVGTPGDRSHEGTGLGLALAKRFVELHGGRIWIQSEVGKGTTFTFAIPVERVAPAPA